MKGGGPFADLSKERGKREMCLSTLYEGKIDPSRVIMEDAAHVTLRDGKIVVMDILGDEKELNGYEIKDLDFMKHYAVLKKISEE